MIKLREAALLSFAICLASCAGSGFRGAPFVIIETESGEGLEFEEFINNVADADVVFLGEEHDNTTCHELQRWTTIALAERREIMISLEQFEADVQDSLDAYLRGEITEASFLEESRPWPNYEEHYRPTIEWARENGVPVIAANIPRRIARKVSQGVGEELQVLGDEHAPWQMNTGDPPYRARFEEAMGGHGGTVSSDLDDWFAAQCIKDEKTCVKSGFA